MSISKLSTLPTWDIEYLMESDELTCYIPEFGLKL